MLSVLSLLETSSLSLSSDEGFSVLGQEQLGDSDVRGLNGDLDDASLLGLFLDLLDIETPSSSIDGLDFARCPLVGPSEDFDDVVSSDGERLDSVFLLELFAQRTAHKGVLDMRGGREVGES